MLTFGPCIDSPALASRWEKALYLPRELAKQLGKSAVEIIRNGGYTNASGQNIDMSMQIEHCRQAKISIPPEARLRSPHSSRYDTTSTMVLNDSTMECAQRMQEEGGKVLALNFANGVHPGGGFLGGARAQEECLCRSSALYATLAGDDMYAYHASRLLPDSSDWSILSPDVPVFRTDDGTFIDKPYLLHFITSAAPYAPTVGQAQSQKLMESRIQRVLSIAWAYGYDSLVLGAWGCGAFAIDPEAIALQFRSALEGAFSGCFSRVHFAIADWSDERRFLGPFARVFS